MAKVAGAGSSFAPGACTVALPIQAGGGVSRTVRFGLYYLGSEHRIAWSGQPNRGLRAGGNRPRPALCRSGKERRPRQLISPLWSINPQSPQAAYIQGGPRPGDAARRRGPAAVHPLSQQRSRHAHPQGDVLERGEPVPAASWRWASG
jgi:hypothetical protein